VKKLLTKILTTACALVLCVLCLTGCSWLKLDEYKYYNQIVVSVGDKDFNKKDLVEAFSNYGYQYYESYGYSLEESIDMTITSMVDRYLLLEEVKKTVTITDQEKLEIRKEAYNHMEEGLKSHETAIITEWDLEVEETEEEEETSLRDVETEYVSKVVYDKLTNTVSRVEEEKETIDISNLPEHFSKDYVFVTNQKVTDEAWTRYVKALQDSAKNEGRSTAEKDVLLCEEDRLIELLTNNKYLEKFEDSFMARTPVDTASVLEYYREQYRSQRERFTASESAYHTAMENASKEYVYYHANSGNEYVNVKHILVNFSEAQKEEIKALNARYGVSDVYSIDSIKDKDLKAQYETQLKTIVNATETTFDNDKLVKLVGKDFPLEALDIDAKQDTFTIRDVEKVVERYVTGDNEDRSQKFNDLIYIFNDDPGIMNSEFDYVVNLDTSITDKMVKSFANGARDLNKEEGEGSFKSVVTEYGIHIIYHDGVAKNLVDEYNFDHMSDEQLLALLCTTTTRPDSDKTIFDLIYDKLNLDEGVYNSMTQELVKDARTKLKQQDIKIVLYVDNYKDLYE